MKIAENLKKFFHSTPAKKCIVGISGGIDSALTLAMAVEAVGKENIIGVLMPYKLGKFSSEENFADAKEICEFFTVESRIFHIDDMADPYEKIFSGMAFGNTLARIRMTLLFGIANEESGIVLGTCNKTEVMLGYETKFGDGAADVNVLGSIFKTQVWEEAKKRGLPEKFIEKVPSAELFENHSDEEEMGFSYAVADRVLQNISKDGEMFSPKDKLEEKIFHMWKNSAHKRDPIPTLEA